MIGGDLTVAETGQEEERLRELLALGESSIEAYFEPRHVADVLQDFSSAKPALSQVSSQSMALSELVSLKVSNTSGAATAAVIERLSWLAMLSNVTPGAGDSTHCHHVVVLLIVLVLLSKVQGGSNANNKRV